MRSLALGFSSIAFMLASVCFAEGKEKARPAKGPSTDEQRGTLFEIREMPKKRFLDFVAETDGLTGSEKKTVKDYISAKVYSHCKLVKYRCGEKLFMVIDQYYPLRKVGRDAKGRPTMAGGSGSRSTYACVDDKWVMVEGMHYD